jgi:hypothetical protein
MRRRRLGDGFAAAAGELLAHMLDHLPLARHHLQRLTGARVLRWLAQKTLKKLVKCWKTLSGTFS